MAHRTLDELTTYVDHLRAAPATSGTLALVVRRMQHAEREVLDEGVLDGTDGVFAVPDDVDLAEYPLVDVSQEPFDDDPEHSGDSIVRGPLREG